MGVKDLWGVLTPHAERKPISELRGKTLAIDLAGWVCESLNVVDYFVHPRQHLKNLFFRTCYLIWEEVIPVFVLEGVAPKLKSQVIAKRNELQFRGVKPRNKDALPTTQASQDKGRTRFNHVLKQCETLLHVMGIQCVQGPGEAEAYCAFLNKHGLVDGVISQDSDCFAYGAKRVYRNFSVSTQGALAAQGGAVDIYDMRQICQKMDFGQNKIIVMALLCGCDYCPDGVGGVGRDGVLKLFNKYQNKDILERIRSWRYEDSKYTALEMRVDDKNTCSYCGHLGRTQSHTKSGCGVCRTNHGCNEHLWKEERLALKAELALRKKALADDKFPCEEIIQEFLREPEAMPNLKLSWKQPNIVQFVRQIGHLLQWPEIYCFQKFLPIITRWHVRNAAGKQPVAAVSYIQPKAVVKKRTQKGVPSLEILWQDETDFFKGLIPAVQLREYEQEHSKGLQELWTTVEPYQMVESAYTEMVATFMKSKEKPKKEKKVCRSKKQHKIDAAIPLGSLENFNDLKTATNDIGKEIKVKRSKKATAQKKKLQVIDNYFKKKLQITVEHNTPKRNGKFKQRTQCSTPITCLPSDLDSDCDNLDMSEIVDGIITRAAAPVLTKYAGRMLHYEPLPNSMSHLLKEQSMDDLDLMAQKRNLSISMSHERETKSRRVSLDDSFDVLVRKQNTRILELLERETFVAESPVGQQKTHVARFKQQQRLSLVNRAEKQNLSYFFNQSKNDECEDVFEKLMAQSFSKKNFERNNDGNDLILISD